MQAIACPVATRAPGYVLDLHANYETDWRDRRVSFVDCKMDGVTGALWGGAVRIFLLHHVTWSINSVCHFFGKRRFRDAGGGPARRGRRPARPG